MRKISRKGLIKKLDKVFSEYIRQRFAKDGWVQCVTCGTRKHWKEVDAGHFVSRRHYSTRWDPSNVHVQCKKCNIFGNGENYLMGKYIDRTYGIGKADELIALSKKICKFTNEELVNMIEHFSRT
tara:strand:- start:1468 stop:1842 length:375 start_codon:yes stop_codon:yes gene_type:complete